MSYPSDPGPNLPVSGHSAKEAVFVRSFRMTDMRSTLDDDGTDIVGPSRRPVRAGQTSFRSEELGRLEARDNAPRRVLQRQFAVDPCSSIGDGRKHLHRIGRDVEPRKALGLTDAFLAGRRGMYSGGRSMAKMGHKWHFREHEDDIVAKKAKGEWR